VVLQTLYNLDTSQAYVIRCISVARVYRVISLINIVRHFLSAPLSYSRNPLSRTLTRAPECQ